MNADFVTQPFIFKEIGIRDPFSDPIQFCFQHNLCPSSTTALKCPKYFCLIALTHPLLQLFTEENRIERCAFEMLQVFRFNQTANQTTFDFTDCAVTPTSYTVILALEVRKE